MTANNFWRQGSRSLLVLVVSVCLLAMQGQPPVPVATMEPEPAERSGEFSLPILAYHRVCHEESDASCVRTADFERQLTWLMQAGYETISFEDLLKWELGIGLLPKKTVVLTFDDGYLDNWTILYPLLRERRMKATVFLTTGFIGTEGFLTWQQVRRMRDGGVEFGSHTQTHPNVAILTSAKQRDDEIAGSKREIEKEIGRPVLAFSYPYGFFDDRSKQAVKAAGYQYGVSGESGYATPRTEPWSLKRIVISGYTEMASFQKKLP